MKTKLFIMIAAATMFAACNKSEEPAPADNGQINLTSGLSLFRSTGQGLQSTNIDATNTAGIFITEDAVTPTVTYDANLQYTADGAGALTPPTGKEPYFPTTGNGVNIYAYAPYNSAYTSLAGADKAFSVKADQSADADYISSDFIWGKPATNPVTRTSSSVNIAFNHKLTKIDFTITPGTGFTAADFQEATVSIMSTKPDTKVNLEDGTVGVEEGTAAAIKAVEFAADATTFTGSAIIVPQTVAKDEAFIQVTLKNTKTLTYKLGKEMKFNSGSKYIYNITANIDALEVTSTIVDWNTGETISGEVNLD